MRAPALLLLLAGCADLGFRPNPPMPEEGTPSSLREMIRLQLDSARTERPPAPVPGREAEALARLPELSGAAASPRASGLLRAP